MISVIIPMYNAEKTIKRTLNSLLSQTFSNIEIIVVDDGSTDASASIVKQYDSRVKYFYQSNSGVSSARNKGIQMATGEYVAFCDSDDIYQPDAMQLLFDASNCADMVVGGVKKYFPTHIEETQIGTVYANSYEEIAKVIVAMTDSFMINQMWGKLFRRMLIIENGIYLKETMDCGEDMDFVCRFCQHINSVQTLSDMVYYYYIDTEKLSLSQKIRFNGIDLLEENDRELSALFEFWNIAKSEKSRLAGRYLSGVWGLMNLVNSNKCTFNKNEKLQYIKIILENKVFQNYFADYGRTELSKASYWILKLKNPSMILFLLQLRKRFS